jgi:hypothetical protein
MEARATLRPEEAPYHGDAPRGEETGDTRKQHGKALKRDALARSAAHGAVAKSLKDKDPTAPVDRVEVDRVFTEAYLGHVAGTEHVPPSLPQE